MYYNDENFSDVHFEPTNACNFHCWMCPREVMTRKIGYMDFDKFKRVVDECSGLDFLENIHFGGFGEPTLHGKFIEMVEYVKKNTGFKISVTTNASKLIDENYVRKLIETGIDKITLSFRHTVQSKIKASTYDLFNYDHFVHSILRLVEIKREMNSVVLLEVAFLKDSYYSKYVLGIKKEEFLDVTKLNKFIKKMSQIVNKKLPTFEELTKGIKSNLSKIDEISVDKDIVLRLDALGPWTTAVKKYKEGCYLSDYGSCVGMETHFSIYCDGSVSTCCADFDAKNVLGNVFNEELDLLAILSKEKSLLYANNLRDKKMPTKTCKICRGGTSRKEKLANVIGSMYVRKKKIKTLCKK